eukprot:7205248-Pyramimonas_sp.AAC.2
MRAWAAREHKYLQTPSATMRRVSTPNTWAGTTPRRPENSGFLCRAAVSCERPQNVATNGLGLEKSEDTNVMLGVGSSLSPICKFTPPTAASATNAQPPDLSFRLSGRSAALNRGNVSSVAPAVISQRLQASE